MANNGCWSFDQFNNRFPNEETARLHVERLRWHGEIKCPFCGSVEVSEKKNHKPMPYRCCECRKHFSVFTKTVFQSMKLPVRKLLMAVYLLTTAKKGVPSTQLGRELGIQQKSAWYLAHRIRTTWMQNTSPMRGEIEIDETYIGGKEENKHFKDKLKAGRGAVGKQAIIAARERISGEIRATMIAGTKRDILQSVIKANVKLGSSVYTDGFRSYENLEGYDHVAVNHAIGEYVDGMAHTNGVESFWALLKRGYHGIYHKFSVKHLPLYVDEFATRHNRRKLPTEKHISETVRNMIGSITYKELIQ